MYVSGVQEWFTIFKGYTPFIAIIKMLAVFPVWCNISFELIYFIPSSSHLLIPPATLARTPTPSPLWSPLVCSHDSFRVVVVTSLLNLHITWSHWHEESKKRTQHTSLRNRYGRTDSEKLVVSKGDRLVGRGCPGGLGWKCHKIGLWWSLCNSKCNRIHWARKKSSILVETFVCTI